MNRTPSCTTRAQNDVCRRQLAAIRTQLGDALTAHCVGIQRFSLDHKTQHPSTMRAVQFIYALLFAAPGPVRLGDVLTSFRYTTDPRERAKNPQAPASCAAKPVVTGDGDGI